METQYSSPEFLELQAVAEKTLLLAKRQGATQAEVHLSMENGFSVHAREGDVDTLEHTREKNLVLTVYFGFQSGTATTSDLSASAISSAVEKASNIARYTGADPYSGLADPELIAKQFPDLKLYHHWDISPAEAIDLALRCEKEARQRDKRIIRTEGVNLSTHDYFIIYANSHGFIGHSSASEHLFSCGLIAEQDQKMQRASEYSLVRNPADLEAPELLADRTVDKVLSRLGAVQITTRQCPIIFNPSTARGLLGSFIRAVSGGSLYREASFLLNHLDQPVFPSFVKIDQRPRLLGGWGSTNFDSEGVETNDLSFVDNGILKSYVLGSYSARKLGLKTTGNSDGVHNLFINTSDQDQAGLLKKMGDGLLVTELMGQGINIITGNYSRGAFGYWVENGVIQYPVEEITIAGNLKDMFANLVSVGNDVDQRGNIQTGSILLEEMTLAGK